MNQDLKNYCLQLADNALIHGHRLSEWCGHGPILEVDMALSNIALDNIGAARNLYQYLAIEEGQGKTEDDYPYKRDVRDFKNILLVELKNGDFAQTIAKCFFFDAFQFHFYSDLQECKNEALASVAEKSLKEVTYHLKFSREWVVRLGDGTDESKTRMQQGIQQVYDYCGEMFEASPSEKNLQNELHLPDLNNLKDRWMDTITSAIQEATLSFPLSKDGWFHSGGKEGRHTEHLGFILSDMQFMQRAYPNLEW